MQLSEAFPIIRRFRPELKLQSDNVCTDAHQHRLDGCRLPDTAVYTEFDAKHIDTAQSLHDRLRDGDPPKPTL